MIPHECRLGICLVASLAGGCGDGDVATEPYYKLAFAECLVDAGVEYLPPGKLAPRAAKRVARESGEGSIAAFRRADGTPSAAFLFFADASAAARFQEGAFQRKGNVLIYYRRKPSARRRMLVSDCLERSIAPQDPGTPSAASGPWIPATKER